MKKGEIWIEKEDGHEVKIIELTTYPVEGEVVWYEYSWDEGGKNYLTRKDFIILFKKKY